MNTENTENNSDVVILQKHQEYTDHALRALKHGYAATISGDEGTGVTTLCEHMVRTWEQENPGRTIFEFTVGEGEDETLKLVQHLAGHILGDEMPTTWALHSTSELIYRISEKIKKAGVGLFFLDRADLAPSGFVDSFLTMTSKCRTAGKRVGLLLGARNTGKQLRLFREFSTTRLGYVTDLKPLGVGEIAGVMVALCPQFADVEQRLEGGDKEAVGALMELGRLSGGKFCRLGLFITNLNESNEKVELNANAMRTLWKKLVLLGDLSLAA